MSGAVVSLLSPPWSNNEYSETGASVSMSDTIYLVDASLYIFRSWHSIPLEFFDNAGASVNAVYGFTRFMCDFLEQARPTHVAIAFDESLTTSFRNAIYPAYKANRELPPEALKSQFAYCQAIATALGCTVLSHSHYEADDLIGSVAAQLRVQNFRSVIVSADKDFGQLIGTHDQQWDFARQLRWGVEGVVTRFGVKPEQMVDFLALTGDAVDNIPGVPGIGPKTAAGLLQHFGTLEELFTRIEELPYLRQRGAVSCYARIKAHREQALLSQQLARIALHAPVPTDTAAFRWRLPDLANVDKLIEQLRFGPITRSRCHRIISALS